VHGIPLLRFGDNRFLFATKIGQDARLFNALCGKFTILDEGFLATLMGKEKGPAVATEPFP